MKDVVYVDQIEIAEVLFKPQRVDVLRQLAVPRSCTEVGDLLNQSPQRVYYHVKKLLDAELVHQVTERRVRGINEGVYQAAARSYWLSPQLVGTIGQRQVRDELSLGYVLQIMEDVQSDLAELNRSVADVTANGDLATLGVSGEIRLPHGDREAFLKDLRKTLQDLFARHGGAEGEAFKLAVACYPKREHEKEKES